MFSPIFEGKKEKEKKLTDPTKFLSDRYPSKHIFLIGLIIILSIKQFGSQMMHHVL